MSRITKFYSAICRRSKFKGKDCNHCFLDCSNFQFIDGAYRCRQGFMEMLPPKVNQ